MLPDERKTCIKCNQSKPLSDYYKDKTVKTGYKSKCKVCCYKYSVVYNKKTKGKRRTFVNRFKTKCGCKKCGYNEHPVALHLNHINPANKFISVSHMIGQHKPWSIIKEEIRKCEVLCANCHSIHTYEKQHWRNRYAT